MARRQRARTATVILSLGLSLGGAGLLAGCAADSPVTTAGTTLGTTPPRAADSAVPGGTTPVLECTDAAIGAVAGRQVPGASIQDLTCGPPTSGQAVATVMVSGAADQVAFFVAGDGGWRLAARAEAAGATDSVVPADFSVSLFRAWADKYDLRMHPPAPTTTGAVRSSPGTSAQSSDAWCQRQGDGYVCKDPRPTTTTSTTRKPTTTATTAPTTVAPTTVAPPTSVTPSAFCLTHPFDPRCAANPGFPG